MPLADLFLGGPGEGNPIRATVIDVVNDHETGAIAPQVAGGLVQRGELHFFVAPIPFDADAIVIGEHENVKVGGHANCLTPQRPKSVRKISDIFFWRLEGVFSNTGRDGSRWLSLLCASCGVAGSNAHPAQGRALLQRTTTHGQRRTRKVRTRSRERANLECEESVMKIDLSPLRFHRIAEGLRTRSFQERSLDRP